MHKNVLLFSLLSKFGIENSPPGNFGSGRTMILPVMGSGAMMGPGGNAGPFANATLPNGAQTVYSGSIVKISEVSLQQYLSELKLDSAQKTIQ